LPTPITREFFLVVSKFAVGAPRFELPVPVAPIAPEPFVPDTSTPIKLMTVIDETTLCERVAVTVAAVRGVGANARHISEVPLCVFVLTTRAQFSAAPATPDTIVFVPVTQSVEINASNNSLPDVVERLDVATVELAVPRSTDTFASITMAAWAVKLTPERSAPLTVTVALAGLNVTFVFVGVIV
jgi:hypothetical protein